MCIILGGIVLDNSEPMLLLSDNINIDIKRFHTECLAINTLKAVKFTSVNFLCYGDDFSMVTHLSIRELEYSVTYIIKIQCEGNFYELQLV